jgi:hypothetical protein
LDQNQYRSAENLPQSATQGVKDINRFVMGYVNTAGKFVLRMLSGDMADASGIGGFL